MRKLFAVAALAIVLVACGNEKKSGEESTAADSAAAVPSQAASAESVKAAADSTVNPADSTKK
jgi:ABC-type enterochelin transport system substrate-binding protein